MMQKLRNPKNVKLISLFIAAIFVLGCFALSVTQSGVGKSAFAASSESAIGVVNYQMLVAQSPDLSKVNEAMNKEIESAQKDFNEKSKSMNEAEKRKYYTQTQERLANKQKELMDPVLKKIEASNVIGGRHEEEQAGKNKCYYCSCSADFGMQYQYPGTAGKNCCYQLGAGGKRPSSVC